MDSTSETSSDESYKPCKKNTYLCTYEDCTASFSKNSKLTYHVRRHTGERPFACNEPDCHKTYLYSFHLRRHKETHHSDHVVERIPCTVEGCCLELANKYSLKKHLKMKHNSERRYPFSCDECQQGFHRKRQLLQHSYVHTGVLPFKCEICNAGFPTLRACNRHRRTHTSYSCKCEKTFERWTQLLSHKKTCETVRPKCNICGKTFTQRQNLKKHLEVHLRGNKNVETFACTYDNCTRSYLYKKNLMYHINKYHEKTPLPRIACTEPNCTQTFFKRQNLQNHLQRVHSNENRKKVARKPRKDKGIPHKTMAAVLTGLKYPLSQNAAAKGLPIKLAVSCKAALANKASSSKEASKDQDNTKEIIKTSQETVRILKDKLKDALLQNLNGSTSKSGNADGKNRKTCVEVLC